MIQVSFSGDFNTQEDAAIAIQLFLTQVQQGSKSAPLTSDEDGNSFSWNISGEEVSPRELFEKELLEGIQCWEGYSGVTNLEYFLNERFGLTVDSLYHDFLDAEDALEHIESL